jgi:CRISPR system Cascade subunit CasB
MAAAGKDVRAFAAKALMRLLNTSDASYQKASLANLRRGVGHTPGEIPQLWGEYLQEMPEEMYGRYGQPSREEWAIYTALTLFALHQQGRDPTAEPMHSQGKSIGTSAALLIDDENVENREDTMKRILRKLNAAATSNSVDALAHYLRSLVQLLRTQGIPLDYVTLAGDIYDYQFPERINAVRLRWGQDFYGTYYRNTKREDEQDEEK